MILVGSQQDGIQQRCAVAGELLDGLSTIPEAYIRAASTAMVSRLEYIDADDNQLHHLAGVGHLLASVIKSPLSPWSHLQARSALLALADLLAIFETSLRSDVKMSSKIRRHVERIESHSQKTKGLGAHLGNQIGVRPKPLYPDGIRFQDDSVSFVKHFSLNPVAGRSPHPALCSGRNPDLSTRQSERQCSSRPRASFFLAHSTTRHFTGRMALHSLQCRHI